MVVTKVSREICLTEYPVGMPTNINFKLVQVEIPEPTKEGDTQLGGTDMDNTIIEYILQEFKQQTGLDIRNDRAAINRDS